MPKKFGQETRGRHKAPERFLNGTRAIGYVRVSTDDQAEYGLSLDAQDATIRATARLNGWHLVTIVREESSGAVPLVQRPGGLDLVRMLAADTAEILCVVDLDRLGRDAQDVQLVVNKLAARDVQVWAGGAEVRVSSMMDRVILNLKAEVSQEERRKIGERTKRALGQARAEGRKWAGRVPMTGRAVEDPTMRRKDGSPVVRVLPNEHMRTIAAVCAGMQGEGVSLRAIGKWLEEQQVPTANGGKWWPTTVAILIAQQSGFAPRLGEPKMVLVQDRGDLETVLKRALGMDERGPGATGAAASVEPTVPASADPLVPPAADPLAPPTR